MNSPLLTEASFTLGSETVVLKEPSFRKVLQSLLPRLDGLQKFFNADQKGFQIFAEPELFEMFKLLLSLCSKRSAEDFEEMTASEGVEAIEALAKLNLKNVYESFQRLSTQLPGATQKPSSTST
jgi:hypothetical protein